MLSSMYSLELCNDWLPGPKIIIGKSSGLSTKNLAASVVYDPPNKGIF